MDPLDPEMVVGMPCVLTVRDNMTGRWHLGFVKAGRKLKHVELFLEKNWPTQREATDALLDTMIAINLPKAQ